MRTNPSLRNEAPQVGGTSRFSRAATPANDTTFTVDYFFQEVTRLRKELGERTFWARPQRDRDAALKAVTFCYFNLANPDGTRISEEDSETAAAIYENLVLEYQARESFCVRGGN